MDCDYHPGIRPDHVWLHCGLSYSIRPGSIRARSARWINIVNVFFLMDIIVHIIHIIISIICVIIYSIIM